MSHALNYAFKISALLWITHLWSPEIRSGAFGHLWLLLPQINLFGVIISKFSKFSTLFFKPIRGFFMLFKICCI